MYATETMKPSYVSLVYANKGDYGSTRGMGQDHFKKLHPDAKPPNSLDEAMELDYSVLMKRLSKVFSKEPQKQIYGEKNDRRTTLRWDFNGHSFFIIS